MLYDVTIKYIGQREKNNFSESKIHLDRDGDFGVMDRLSENIRFLAKGCKVDQIAADLIIISGYTHAPTKFISAYCKHREL